MGLAIILVAGLLPRIARVTLPGMYFDECCSWKISQFPWDEMLDAIARDAHPPVFYLLLRGVGQWVGDSPIIIRGVGIVFGMATIVAAFSLVRLGGAEGPGRDVDVSFGPCEVDFAALLGAMLVASSALQIEVSLQGRPYTFGTLLALLAAIFLLRATGRGGRWFHWAGFAVTSGLLSFTHYYGLFTVASLLVFAALALLAECLRNGWSSRGKEMCLGVGLSVWGLISAWSLWLPVFLFQRNRATAQLWMPPLTSEEFGKTLWMVLAGGKTTGSGPAIPWLAVVAWTFAVLGLLLFGNRAGRLAAVCAAGPLLVAIAYGVLVRNILGVKYLAFAHIFLLAGWALLVSQIRWRPGRFALAAGLILWNGFWCWQFIEARELQAEHPGICGAVEYLDQRRRPDEPVIVGSPFVFLVVQKYSRHPDGIFVSYDRDHRQDVLGGPPLRESEYRNFRRHLRGAVDHCWAVDVFELFGPESRFVVKLPDGWVKVGQEQFRETYGLPCVVAVREYRRQGDSLTESASGDLSKE